MEQPNRNPTTPLPPTHNLHRQSCTGVAYFQSPIPTIYHEPLAPITLTQISRPCQLLPHNTTPPLIKITGTGVKGFGPGRVAQVVSPGSPKKPETKPEELSLLLSNHKISLTSSKIAVVRVWFSAPLKYGSFLLSNISFSPLCFHTRYWLT